MQFRFRYLEADGREVEVESIDALRDLLRSGDIAPDTLLYDVLTSEWAPLRAHAVIRLLEDVGEVEPPAADADQAAAGADELAADADEPAGDRTPVLGPEGGFELPDLELTLSDDDAPSTEDAVRELLKERERDSDQGSTVGTTSSGFTGERDWSGGMVVDAGMEPPPPSEEPPGPAGSDPERRGESGGRSTSGDAPRVRPRPPGDDWSAARRGRGAAAPAGSAPSSRSRSGLARPLAAVGGGGLVALLVYAAVWSSDGPAAPAQAADPAPAELTAPVLASATAEPAAPPTAVSLLGASEAVALEDMVEALDSLRRASRVSSVPRDWLEGIYLADAGRYPEVRAYWERYQAFVDEVRQRDTALFRQSFVRRLQSQGVTGSMVPMRLARAIRLFEESQPARDTVYEAMADLARASLELHDLLVEREDDIVYDPVLPDRVSRDPVVEAVTDDDELHDRIWGLLDRIFYDLSVLSGGDVATRDAFTERSLDGIRATGGR